MHAVQIGALRHSLATDTWTGSSAVTAFDGFALPLELRLVLTNDEDRSPEPPKRSSSPGTSPGSWKPAFEAQVARSSPFFGVFGQQLSGCQDIGALTSIQQWPATGAQYVPTSQYPLSVVQHDCTGQREALLQRHTPEPRNTHLAKKRTVAELAVLLSICQPRGLIDISKFWVGATSSPHGVHPPP
jgi:hypothetical protein